MERRPKYVIRNDDEGWTYTGIENYEIELLSSYARRFTPGVREMDIVMKNYVGGAESPPHFVIGTITLDEPKHDYPINDFPAVDFSALRDL